MRLETTLSDFAQATPECLFLPAEAGLQIPEKALDFDRTVMHDLTAETISLLGLDTVLRPGGEYPDDIVAKPHDKVAKRDPAVAEQFHHPDVATNGFCGIFLIGLEGEDPANIPETRVTDNAAMVEHIGNFVDGGVLENRLDDVVVVRPYFDADKRDEWMDLPRHSLERLGSKFEPLLSQPQAEHVRSERTKVTDTSEFTGEVYISNLAADSIIDGSPLLTCGVAQRELRLTLEGEQTDKETIALEELHDEITRYLLDQATPEKAVKVVKGSAIFVPVNQLHRATPYRANHRRSVVGVRCYAQPDQTSPASWQPALGTKF